MIVKHKGRDYHVGPIEGRGRSRYMVYVGVRHKLRGKHALVCDNSPNGICAQFDDVETGFGLGWWLFPETDFIDAEVFDKEFSRQKKEHNYSHNHAMRKTIERFSK